MSIWEAAAMPVTQTKALVWDTVSANLATKSAEMEQTVKVY